MTRYFGIHTLEGEWHSLLPRYALLSDRIESKQILDIGCGSGIGSSLLLELGAQRVNAIDHRPEVLELARVKHAKQGLDFHVMFWEELDFPDDSFDMVLCLDPSSPVTDPSLLREIKRVLRPGGEYVCAIERRNVEGMESLLPRYGYSSAGEDLELTGTGERVPQLGELEQLFETIVSVVQRPRYSFVFDYAPEDEAMHTMRRSSASADESGLWVGENPHPEDGSAEQTDNRPGRWISIDRRLTAKEGESAAVELLFCGDEHMPPPTLREIQMPYRGLVDRLHQLFSDLQLRQHPDQRGWASEDDGTNNQFMERERTSEFRSPPLAQGSGQRREGPARTSLHYRTGGVSTHVEPAPSGEWHHVREQLDRMTRLYEEVRTQMEDLFVHTRQEIEQRDRYIEQLVDTVHHQRHQSAPVDETTAGDDEAPADPFERTKTNIYRREDVATALNSSTDQPLQEEEEESEPMTTQFVVDVDGSLDEESEPKTKRFVIDDSEVDQSEAEDTGEEEDAEFEENGADDGMAEESEPESAPEVGEDVEADDGENVDESEVTETTE